MTTVGSARRVGRASGLAALALVLAGPMSGCRDDDIRKAEDALEADRVVDFGAVPLGRHGERSLQLRNMGVAAATFARPSVDPAGSPFAVGPLAALRVPSGQALDLPLRFEPQALGDFEARLVVLPEASGRPAIEVTLRGRGVLGRAEPLPPRLDFGRVAVRATSTLPFVFVNSADDPAEVVVEAPTGADSDFFEVRLAGGLSVEPHSSVSLNVTFKPARPGDHAARLPVRPCPSCAVQELEMVGEGVAATLVVDPVEIDFGLVEVGGRAVRTVVARNVGTVPVDLRSVAFDPGAGADLALTPVAPVVLRENDAVTLEVSFAPLASGPQRATLRLLSDARGSEQVVVPVRGQAGGPRIQAVPERLAFPRSGVGFPVEKRVTLRNVGSDPTGTMPLEITGYAVVAGQADWTAAGAAATPAAPLRLGAGAQTGLTVTFHPSVPGDRTGTLRVTSNDPLQPVLDIPLTGRGVTLSECEWKAVPPRLDFGLVTPGTRQRLAFQLRNTGAHTCQFYNVRAAPGTSPAFAPEPISARLIPPGGALLVPVEFEPDGAGGYTGAVEFDTSSAAAPQGRVELVAAGAPTCLTVTPMALLFGTVGLACEPTMQSVLVANECQVPVTLGAATVGAGGDAFLVQPASGLPLTLQPGAQTRIDVTYAPAAEGQDIAPLYLETSLAPQPYLVSLQGFAALRPTNTDRYQQPPIPKVDFLFVVDNSGSFLAHQDALGDNFDRFIAAALSRGIDFQIAATTTGLRPWSTGTVQCPGGVRGGEDGRFFPVDNSRPRILTRNTPNLHDVFMDNVHPGTCHADEYALEAARRALSPPLVDNADDPRHPEPDDGNAGFLRPDASLYVLYTTDQDDESVVPTSTFIQHLQGLKPGRPDMVHAAAIVGQPGCTQIETVGTRIMEVVRALNGPVGDVCDPDWGGILQRIGDDAFKPIASFPLTQMPDGRDVVVEVDGDEVPPVAADGTENWHYDPTIGPYGAVVFAPGREPGPNAKVEVTYPVPCPLFQP